MFLKQKIFIVSGTRPEVIKLAPLFFQLQKDKYNVLWVAAGQHDSLQKQALSFFGITPDYLFPKIQSSNLSDLVGKLVLELSGLFVVQKPNIVVVQGDTATTLAAAQAAYFLQIPVVYLEAGLRSFDLMAPFPEEANRQLISRISTFLFVPTLHEVNNLRLEGITKNVFVVGNTVVDALMNVCDRLEKGSVLVTPSLQELVSRIKELGFKLLLLSMHRRESLDGLSAEILRQLPIFLDQEKSVVLIYVRHLNPSFAFIGEYLSQKQFAGRVFILDPLDYKDMVFLLQNSFIILADSGGLLEEAVSLNKLVVCLREKSERYFEALRDHVFLVGPMGCDFLNVTRLALSLACSEKKVFLNPFGDGQSAEKIVNVLQHFLGFNIL